MRISLKQSGFALLGLLAFVVWTGGSAVRAQPLFTVEDVQVDVTADNALAARDQAFEKAQRDAFNILVKRMAQDGMNLTVPDARVISTLVQDYEVTQEKLSSVRYVGTYTFRFRGRAVQNYLQGQNATYADAKSPAVLVLPFYKTPEQTVLWSPDNPWLASWQQSRNDAHALVPVTVPMGDMDDMRSIGDDQAFIYDREKLQLLLTRYGAQDAVITIAERREDGVLSVDIYRTDQARPAFVTRINVSGAATSETGTAAGFMTAVQQVKQALQTDWKSKTAVTPQTSSDVFAVRVSFDSLNEWTSIYGALRRITAIDQIALKSLRPTQARLLLSFQGSVDRLQYVLAQANMRLESPVETQNASYGGYAREAEVIYDLVTNARGGRRGSSYIQRF